MEEFVCKYCGRVFDNINSLSGHISHCDKNPNRKERDYSSIGEKVKNTRAKKKHEIKEFDVICSKCGKPYKVRTTQENFDKGNYSKFCSISCRNSHVKTEESKLKVSRSLQERNLSQKGVPKEVRDKILLVRDRIFSCCDDKLFTDIINSSTTWEDIISKLKLNLEDSETKAFKAAVSSRCRHLGLTLTIRLKNKVSIGERTKGELINMRSNYQSYRSSVRRDAEKIFSDSGIPRECAVCGYSHHVEIAHLRSVSSFPDDAKISEINSIDNLLPLCPNHHWEFDNGILSLDELLKLIKKNKDKEK